MPAYNHSKPSTRKEVAYNAAEIDFYISERARSPETLQEDTTFLRKLRSKDIRDYRTEEIHRLIRIAEKGQKTHCAVDKSLADISRWEHEKIRENTINHGLKYGEIFRRARELLRGLQG